MSAIQLGFTPISNGSLELQPIYPDDADLSTEHEDEEEPEDYTGHSVHAEGVPRCELRLVARDYRSNEFAQTVFRMLQLELRLDGWANLPDSHQASISIYKVGGSLTNAVFFVSCPFISPPPDADSPDHPQPPPTVLLRIYGPSSGSLISRKHELHLLHTLSVQCGIGPLVLGTFHNGRVEEYFESRPLMKHEMRDPVISRWIARRMRELHSVDLRTISTTATSTLTDDEIRPELSTRSSHPRSASQQRRITNSTTPSSQLSWSSSYSSSSSDFSAALIYADRPSISSPSASPHLFLREARSLGKKHSRDSLRSSSAGSLKPDKLKIGAWENITRWQREAEKVIALIDKAFEGQPASTPPTPTLAPTCPLETPATLLAFVHRLDLPRLIQEIKAYRTWVRKLEHASGKSPRVFCHNDTQYGNLLLRELDEPLLKDRAHEQILVIDFEYASANPRAFDIANHFHEWCADYHHPSHAHSLTHHSPYPTLSERQRFYRAYLNQPESEPSQLEHVNRLEKEVSRWSPASHAMWALWGLVQAQDDIKDRLAHWNGEVEVEFDYLSYSIERVMLFRALVKDLGVC
ncbi:hypothetical protein CROQUDRAFT_667891 [Cronartium quercuum f. sp. fusiforme G11]|uniref:Choline kinase n=1 Tax=Cronartium quercuum f. sp. fusiforme G11 TaxID=708437 RepID=A0A9P6NWU1_9BASI|nr:hypothetical protein CROQUDRAFT_667891 [Cronartium quercuum f. sp. fusiforme G11]